jgi:hypothetical protein
VPLTAFQSGVARLISVNRTPDSYLAGGAALHLSPQSKRYSNDLDFFQDSEQRVASAFEEDRQTLERAGYTVELRLSQPGFVRVVVRQGGDATKVEWAHDSAWRFMPAVKSDEAGYVLHPVDLAINKLLALVGRDEPRDFLDIMYVHERVLPLGAMCWAAAGKDPGFTPWSLLELLRRRGRYRPEDFARLRLVEAPDLPALKTRWLEALDEAEAFVRSRPAGDIGCLYYDAALDRFVAPTGTQAVVPHHGRPGGVLPIVSDAP